MTTTNTYVEFECGNQTPIEFKTKTIGESISVIGHGSYPYEPVNRGRKWGGRRKWSHAAILTRQAAQMLLLGRTTDNQNWLVNKTYVMYAYGFTYVYAVYNHDDNYSIIRREVYDGFNKETQRFNS